MKVGELHRLDLSPPEARRLQEELAPKVVAGPALDLSGVRHVAGADVSTQDDMAYATVVVLEFPGLSPVEVQGFEAPLRFPYVPGLLSFREVPSLAGALRKVETHVDALILDAQGLAHPRRMGLASHLGIFLDVPTVGCAKSRLVGSYEEPGREKGSATDLVHRGETVGRVVRTREGVSPVYVSVGNGIDLKSSVELVIACCTKYRLPESTRQAHNAANRLRRGEEPGGTMRFVFSGILPNSMAPLIVQSTLTLATAILDVAALSFLGLGARAPSPEWGAMLTDAFRSGFGVFVEGQHAIIFPGIAIALAVLSVNFIGDGLRDALDPRRR